jgi:hypothetical protein
MHRRLHGKLAFAGLCVAVALSGLLVTACGKATRQIVVIDGDKAEFVHYGVPPQGQQAVWAPGRTLLFRSESAVPGAPQGIKGKTGHVYRVNDRLEMKEVDKFDPNIPNDTLAYRYGS